MLKEYNRLFKVIFFLNDILLGFIASSIGFYIGIRFQHFPLMPTLFLTYLLHSTVPILFLYIVVFLFAGLYRPRRNRKITEEIKLILISSFWVLSVVLITDYFFNLKTYSLRLHFFLAWIFCFVGITGGRIVLRHLLRFLRAKGHNLRHIIIVGTDSLAREVASKIQKHFEFGLNIKGFLGGNEEDIGKVIDGIRVIGVYRDIPNVIEKEKIDQVIFSLPVEEERMLRSLLDGIVSTKVDVKLVSDLFQFYTLRKNVEYLEDIMIVSLGESPLYGWASFCKRLLDIVISIIVIVMLSPLFLLIAIMIKLTSKGPVFYQQERIGLDGQRFVMFKFRTMQMDAEEETGPIWAKEGDERRTGIGVILRRTSLDESPQFVNVLLGDMSLVGPRPERSIFIEKFRQHIPRYMLRHKIKTGMTGWAQVQGWRGNTSVEKRIEADIYYLKNWSIWLDLKILLMTIPTIIRGRSAC